MQYINAHTHHPAPEHVLAVANLQHDLSGFPATTLWSAGIHPWHIRPEQLEQDYALLADQLQRADVVAVGECGLDRLARTPLDLQIEVFNHQLHLASRYDKPVIIHNVRAGSDLLQLRKGFSGITPWLIHGYHGSVREAELFVQQGCYLGFGKKLLNPSSRALAACAAAPLTSILPETDNEPLPVEEVYHAISVIKRVPLEEVVATLYENFCRLFGLGT